MTQRTTLPTHRLIDLSDAQKADIAAMTDKEFRRWFYERIDFMATHIDPSALTVPARIVEAMNASRDLPISVASRLYLAQKYYGTLAYQRIFVEPKEVSA